VIAALVGLAALLGAAGFLLLGGGADGDGGSAGEGTTTTTDTVDVVDETTSSTEPQPTSTTDPYAAVEPQFVGDCVDDPELQSQLPDVSERQAFCQCSFDAIRSGISFDRFLELDAEADQTGNTPAEIATAVQPCVDSVG
jgi:hypothetical protein